MRNAIFLCICLGCLPQAVRGETCPDNSISFTVSSSADARNLSQAMLFNCSGTQNFVVEWVGNVTIEESLHVLSGDTLSITGTDRSTSVIDGGWGVQLFNLSYNSTLALEAVTLMRGMGSQGGAAHIVQDCHMNAINCTFVENFATEEGGAVFAKGSKLNFSGFTYFSENSAQDGSGGAIVAVESSISAYGDVFFESNSATRYGGAIKCTYGIFDMMGTAFMADNYAESGGALDIGHSQMAVAGYLGLFRNTAVDNGGALDVMDSTVDLVGTVNCELNQAGEHGGALYLWREAAVTLDGELRLLGNYAGTGVFERGGGIAMERSSLVIDGPVHISDNVAEEGGGLSVYEANVTFRGESIFENNTASSKGGGLFAHGAKVNLDGDVYFLRNTAQDFGGAVHAEDDSVVTIDGQTDAEFLGNTAGISGDDVNASDSIVVVNDEVYGEISGGHRLLDDGRVVATVLLCLLLPIGVSNRRLDLFL